MRWTSGHQIKDYIGNGSKYNLKVSYPEDGDQLLGTGGSIKKACKILDENFFISEDIVVTGTRNNKIYKNSPIAIEVISKRDIENSGALNVNDLLLQRISIVPEIFTLLKSFPNPFNPVTSITYTIPEDSYIQLDVFSVNGKMIKHLENSFKLQGNYSVSWDGKDMIGKSVGSGIYIAKLSTEKEILSHKVLLLK